MPIRLVLCALKNIHGGCVMSGSQLMAAGIFGKIRRECSGLNNASSLPLPILVVAERERERERESFLYWQSVSHLCLSEDTLYITRCFKTRRTPRLCPPILWKALI